MSDRGAWPAFKEGHVLNILFRNGDHGYHFRRFATSGCRSTAARRSAIVGGTGWPRPLGPQTRGKLLGAAPHRLRAVTPIELAIYASEMKLLLIGLACLAAIFFAAALLFAFFFGTVNPRLRRADALQLLKAETERSRDEPGAEAGSRQRRRPHAALEHSSALLEKEVHRLDGIRKRTDSSLVETKALLARLQTVTAHVDMP